MLASPAVQFFTGPHLDYHRPTDTIERIDFSGLVSVAKVAKEAIEYLASRPDALTSTLRVTDPHASGEATPPKSDRRVSLGTIPDFTYQETGVRITGTTPESPAEKAGLQAEDVIIRLGDTAIDDFAVVLTGTRRTPAWRHHFDYGDPTGYAAHHTGNRCGTVTTSSITFNYMEEHMVLCEFSMSPLQQGESVSTYVARSIGHRLEERDRLSSKSDGNRAGGRVERSDGCGDAVFRAHEARLHSYIGEYENRLQGGQDRPP